jgi:beta-glucosidase
LKGPLGGYAGGSFVHLSPLEGIASALGVDLPQNRIPAVDFTSIDWNYKFVNCVLPDSSLGRMRSGWWVELPAADFTGVTTISVRASAMHRGGAVEIRADAPGGPLICRIPVESTGGWDHWRTFSSPVKPPAGFHAIYLVFTGPASSEDLLHLDWIELLPGRPVVSKSGVKVTSVLGCTVAGPENETWLSDAEAAAREADIAVVVVGDDQTVDHEQLDRKDIKLPGAQHKLIEVVSRANPRTVVVITSNCPVAIPAEERSPHVPAILCAYAAGQAGGRAIADVLFGDYNPGGKLAETWFTGLKQLPRFHDFNIMNNRTYMYFKGRPLYAFGHGLSYTTFALSHLRTSKSYLGPGGSVAISVTVKNTGDRTGDEVAQFYIVPPPSPVQRPIKQLVAFKRVENLQPGESRRITVSLPWDHPALRYWDVQNQMFVVQPGNLQIQAGNASDNILLHSSITLMA